MAILDIFKRIFSAGGLDPSNPAIWSGESGPSRVSTAGEAVSPTTAMALSAYYASIRNISEDVGKLPLKMYERLEGRGKRPAPEHPIYGLIHDTPNDDSGSITFRETLTSWALGWGNGYAEIVRDPSHRPIGLWPIHPSRVNPRYDKEISGQMSQKASHVVYFVKMADGNEVPFRQDSIFHLRGLGDGLTGFSVASIGCDSIGRALATQRFSGKFYANGTSAGGVFTFPGTLKDSAMKRLRETWPSGLPSAHKPLFLEGGMDWKPISIPPEEAQMLETMEFTVSDVARWFRMPPHKIQDLARATFDNIEHQSLEYVGDTLHPWLVRWEQEITRKLLLPAERGRYFAEHVVLGLLRGDQDARAKFFSAMFQIGAFSQNDIREAENMNPIPGGDVYYVPLNLGPTNEAGPTPRPEPAKPTKTANRREQYKKATARMFADAAARILRKETNAVLRASKKFDGSAMLEWSQKFYSEHEATVRDTMMPAAEALADLVASDTSVGVLEDTTCDIVKTIVAMYASEHVTESMRHVEESVSAGTLTTVADSWCTVRPAVIAEQLTERTACAVAMAMETCNDSC